MWIKEENNGIAYFQADYDLIALLNPSHYDRNKSPNMIFVKFFQNEGKRKDKIGNRLAKWSFPATFCSRFVYLYASICLA